MKTRTSGLNEDSYSSHDSYARTPEEQRKQIDYYTNIVMAKDTVISENQEKIKEMDTEIDNLNKQIEALKSKNDILSKYNTPATIKLSEIPDFFGEDDKTKLNKTLSFIKKHNLIITK